MRSGRPSESRLQSAALLIGATGTVGMLSPPVIVAAMAAVCTATVLMKCTVSVRGSTASTATKSMPLNVVEWSSVT